MALPEAVQKAVKEGEDAMEALLQQGKTDVPPVENPPEETPAPEEVTPPAKPDEPAAKPEEQPDTTAIIEQLRAENEQLRTDVERITAAKNVIDGKYNAEVRDILRSNEQIAKLQEQVSQLLAKKEEKGTHDNFIKELEAELLNDPDMKYVHDEQPEVWKSLVATTLAVSKKLRPAEKDNSRVERIEKKMQDNEKVAFWNVLVSDVPDWEAIAKDPVFHALLDEREDFSGKTYRELMKEAADTALEDGVSAGKKVAKIYRLGKERKGNGTPAKKEEASEADPKQKKLGLSNKGKGEPNIKETDSDILTAPQIAQFYDDLQRGKYKGRADAEKEMQRKITLTLNKAASR